MKQWKGKIFKVINVKRIIYKMAMVLVNTNFAIKQFESITHQIMIYLKTISPENPKI